MRPLEPARPVVGVCRPLPEPGAGPRPSVPTTALSIFAPAHLRVTRVGLLLATGAHVPATGAHVPATGAHVPATG
ncbi:hypothetical protein, partial [Methylobacterium sp. Leaf89]|uniref:hypothetical protein n=1 Tax=Methylobacterium sp. Leaf89 TaxID=1736245 RepID=UPI001910679D